MLFKKLSSKSLNAVFVLAISSVLLGFAFTHPVQAMEQDNEETYHSSIVTQAGYDPTAALVNAPMKYLSDEIMLKLMIHTVGEKGQLPLAAVSKYFHGLSCDQAIFRTMTIKSELELQELLASRNPSREKALAQGIRCDGYELPLARISSLKITKEANPTLADINKVFVTFPFLTKLDLIGAPTNRQLILVEILTLCLNKTSLTELSLEGLTNPNTLSEHTFQSALNLKQVFQNNSTLKTLSLRNNNLDDTTAYGSAPLHMWITDSLKTNTTLTSLDLSHNNMEYICTNDFELHPSLTSLNLSYSNSQMFCFQGLAKNTALIKLDLSYNEILGPLLCNKEFFEHNTTLRELNLQHNQICENVHIDRGTIGSFWQYYDELDEFGSPKWKNFNTPLKILNLAENKISNDDACYFVSLLSKCNSSLVELKLQGNQPECEPNITPETLDIVNEMLERNKLMQGK